MVEKKIVFAKGNLINKDQFNTMSEIFSEQFREFKQEVQDQLLKNAATSGGIGLTETAQSSQIHQPIQQASTSPADLLKLKDDILASKELERQIKKVSEA